MLQYHASKIPQKPFYQTKSPNVIPSKTHTKEFRRSSIQPNQFESRNTQNNGTKIPTNIRSPDNYSLKKEDKKVPFTPFKHEKDFKGNEAVQ